MITIVPQDNTIVILRISLYKKQIRLLNHRDITIRKKFRKEKMKKIFVLLVSTIMCNQSAKMSDSVGDDSSEVIFQTKSRFNWQKKRFFKFLRKKELKARTEGNFSKGRKCQILFHIVYRQGCSQNHRNLKVSFLA